MLSRFVLAGAALMAGAMVCAFAGAGDYVFEPVQTDVTRGEPVIAVRLKHKATGNPVTDAVIFRTRIDMAPDAMAEMEAPLTPVPSSEPGVYAFKAELSMEGRWQLTIAAKVQGERETVIGQVTFEATR